MLVSENWLREFVSPKKTTQEIADQLTMAGLEVDAIESNAAKFSGVVVAKITEIAAHPDAEKLRVCQVFDGVETAQVVCGAPNARQGLVVAFAKVGAVLPDISIKAAKLRGVESFGMLCGEPELALGDNDDGLMELAADAPLGMALDKYLALDDNIIEVDLTPNRADCFSMLGIARDLAAINGLAFDAPVFADIDATITDTISVDRDASTACPRYVSRVIKGIDISQASPMWIQEKLRRSGLRAIDAVVDVTNLVLLELGQPMHAFDLASIDTGITIRMANDGEKISLLNDQTVALNSDTLVIADASGAAAIAGVMGGSRTAVSATTQDIVLESAFFDPISIAGKARHYGLHTDSSMRFERGVDFLAQERAINRATQLLLDIVGGSAGPVVVSETTEALRSLRPIALRKEKLSLVTGMDVDAQQVLNIFECLGCKVVMNEAGWLVTPPSWRFDFAIEADLIEEIARIVGYSNLPVSLPSVAARLPTKPEGTVTLDSMKDRLTSAGYQEIITYSFIAPELHALFSQDKPVAVQNPISADMAVMRASLIPGLVSTAKYNLNRQQKRLRLFETGLTYLNAGDTLPKQDMKIAGLITGDVMPESWSQAAREVDFFDLKGDLDALLPHLSRDLTYDSVDISYLHPGQSAVISLQGEALGIIGALHPSVAKDAGLDQTSYVFELDYRALSQKSIPVFEAISRFPEVRRDIAVIVDDVISAAMVSAVVSANAGDNFKDLSVFDVYQGKGIENHRKSMAIGLTFQSTSSTLTDEIINPILEQVIKALGNELNATLRN